MASETLYDRRRPGFPKESNDGKSYRVSIEYIGLETDLRSDGPVIGEPWGDYIGIVDSVDIETLENTDYAVLSVTMELRLDQTTEMSGTKQETTYEIDWVTIARPLMEHREFNVDGAFPLADTDRVAIDAWINETDPGKRETYTYGNTTTGTIDTLTASAKKYAQGILLGIEYFNYKAPVLRLTESYVNGPPPVGTAGLKETPPAGFPGMPSGYEWVKDSDRSIKAGKNNRWERTQEWVGAEKVLIDSEGIFWEDADLA